MRLPLTSAALEQEGLAIVEAFMTSPAFLNAVKGLVMASIKDLETALSGTKSSIDTLVGKVGQSNGGIDPADLDPILAEITSLKSTVDTLSAALNKPADKPADAPSTAATAVPAPAPAVAS